MMCWYLHGRNERTFSSMPIPLKKIGTVVLFERWLDSEAYLNQVLPSDHYRRYLDLTEALYVAPREVTFLTPIEWADEGC